MNFLKSRFKELALNAFELEWEEFQWNLKAFPDFRKVLELIEDLKIESKNLEMKEIEKTYGDTFYGTEFFLYPSVKELENLNALSNLIHDFLDSECRLIKGNVVDEDGKEHTTYFVCTDDCNCDNEKEFLRNAILDHCDYWRYDSVKSFEETFLKFDDVIYILEKIKDKASYKDGKFDVNIFEELIARDI